MSYFLSIGFIAPTAATTTINAGKEPFSSQLEPDATISTKPYVPAITFLWCAPYGLTITTPFYGGE